MNPMPPSNPRYATACAGQTQGCGAAWSSSPISDNADNAWNVNFDYGNDNNDNKNNANQVRLVRSGQCDGSVPAAPLSFRALHSAWQSARRRKKPSHNQLAFESGWLDSLSTLAELFANVYLDALDQFVKHTLKCRHYVRFVDDFVLLHQDPTQLAQWQLQIEQFLGEQLRLTLKPQILRGAVTQGVDFLGCHVFPHHLTVRPRVLAHARERLSQLQATMQPHALRATVASYWGHFAHAKAHKARQALCRAYPWLRLWFASPEQSTPCWRQPPVGATRLAHQLNWLRGQFPHATVRVQRGLSRTVLPGCADQVVWVRETGVLPSGLRQRVVVGGASCRRAQVFSVYATRTK